MIILTKVNDEEKRSQYLSELKIFLTGKHYLRINDGIRKAKEIDIHDLIYPILRTKKETQLHVSPLVITCTHNPRILNTAQNVTFNNKKTY